VRKFLIVFLALVLNLSAPVASASDEESVQPARLEFGATFGSPAILNGVIGYWTKGNLPLVINATAGYLGSQSFRGAQLDLGLGIDNYGSFRQVLSISGGTYRYNSRGRVKGADYVGPSYIFNLNGFRVQAGLGYGWLQGDDTALIGYSNIGYTFLFDL